ncbi:Homocysteine S-methyltransferase [Candidatus Rhodobacter oscarellae]|uniref:Homocysteine S-methyltransferase n=1 Tax=Candidatus Rhodobacter oscarellae TaxID=1675527 RepID=A0A0J9E8X8_9RHOB|nr:homocysteine S-methyltransferase family protein [Candidatus Rhodobacter lobularis]KMW58109.1 Homocysteine S-methyltransferase [Candidatus Rhodobacter lobularis]
MAVTLLDGSIGQELVKRLGEQPTPLWSTKVMLDRPELVEQVHRAYFEVGAEVATLNTYPLLRNRLDNNGIGDRFELLHNTARGIGLRARAAHGAGRVAASLGPLGASYRPDLAPPVPEAAREYAEIVALHDAEVDLHLIETASGLRLAEGALAGCVGATKPVWLAVSVSDDDGSVLRSGEPLADVLPLVDRFRPEALLVNCSTPEAVSQSLPIIAPHGIPFGAYANGFTRIADDFKVVQQTVDSLTARADLSPKAYADFAEGWAEAGASIIGGCCEVGPDHIAELKRRFG